MTAEELMTADPLLVRRHTTLRAAAELMRDHETRVLPVIEDHDLVGVLTDRAVVVRAIARGVGPLTGYVEDSMSPDGLTCRGQDSAEMVADKMTAAAQGHIVVIDEQDFPIGVIEVEDFVLHDATLGLARTILESIARARASR